MWFQGKDGYRVLTFGNGEMSWRMIDCRISHYPFHNGICINGVLYYIVIGKSLPFMLVCCDDRFETFTFLALEDLIWKSTLINCNGKLGAVLPDSIYDFTGSTTSLQLWVLDDAENQKWSKHVYVLPPLWRDVVGHSDTLYTVGMIGTGEFVFTSYYHPEPYIFFYNVVRNTVVKVELQLGSVASKFRKLFTFVDHVQDVKLQEALRS